MIKNGVNAITWPFVAVESGNSFSISCPATV
jgi:hypothetical protein